MSSSQREGSTRALAWDLSGIGKGSRATRSSPAEPPSDSGKFTASRDPISPLYRVVSLRLLGEGLLTAVKPVEVLGTQPA